MQEMLEGMKTAANATYDEAYFAAPKPAAREEVEPNPRPAPAPTTAPKPKKQ